MYKVSIVHLQLIKDVIGELVEAVNNQEIVSSLDIKTIDNGNKIIRFLEDEYYV